jgi:hypothetical protein
VAAWACCGRTRRTGFPVTWLCGVGCLCLRQILVLFFFIYQTKTQNHPLLTRGILNLCILPTQSGTHVFIGYRTSYSFLTYALLSPLHPCASHAPGCSVLVNESKISGKEYREPRLMENPFFTLESTKEKKHELHSSTLALYLQLQLLLLPVPPHSVLESQPPFPTFGQSHSS